MSPTRLTILLSAIALLAVAGLACAGGDESESFEYAEDGLTMAQSTSSKASEDMASDDMEMEMEMAMMEAEEEAFDMAMAFDDAASSDFDTDSSGPVAVPVTQQRMIVRSAEVSIEVEDVEESLTRIAKLAADLGGWVVSSEESLTYTGHISVRIPADKLDSAISSLRSMAADVRQVLVTSRDVTDEYVDNRARLTNLQATAEALRGLLEQTADVEDALKVHESLTGIQSEVERLQGRIKLLEQTSAFSLLNVSVSQTPGELVLEAGPDVTSSVGQAVRFRATFTPPEGLDTYSYTWEFGDGSHPVTNTITAPTADEDTRVTATVTHVYRDDVDSPYIAGVELTAWGYAGLFEGSDTITVSVTRLPSVEVFAEGFLTAEEGEEVELTATFTRPPSLTNIRYRWEFGDGSPLAEGAVEEGATLIAVTHVYEHYRPQPYPARVTLLADSAAGDVEATAYSEVFIEEAEGLVVLGWSAGEQGENAVRALIAIGQILLTILIWAAVLSPLWIIAGGAYVVVVRRRRRAAALQPSTSDEE